MATFAKRSFAGGEISPSLYARTDTVKYATGLKKCRNFFVQRHGGVANRPGSRFVCEVKDSSKTVRLIPFQFNVAQTYVLEFGDEYMRVIRNGAQVTNTPVPIGGSISNSNPALVTSAAHGFSDGEIVTITGVVGMPEINNRVFEVDNATTNTFTLKDTDGSDVDSTGYGTYVLGGEVAEIYEIATPYAEADLPNLKFVQSADIITIVHPSYEPRELARTADNNWTLTTITFAPGIAAPTNVANTGPAASVAGDDFAYVVTALDEDTFEESVGSSVTVAASFIDPDPDRDGICQAQQPNSGGVQNLTINGALTSGGAYNPSGSFARRVSVYAAADDSSRTFTIQGTDQNGNPQVENVTGPAAGITVSTEFFYGSVTQVSVDDDTAGNVEVGVGETDLFPNTVSWTAVSGAGQYNVYKSLNGVYGFIGVAEGTSFEDTGIDPDVTVTPPQATNPFNGANNYPSAVTYYQQRLLFANTNNNPETVWASRTANFKNFSSSTPLQDDDSISFSLVGRQVNSIKDLLPLDPLVIMTQGGEHLVRGDDAGILRPNAINQKQQTYYGSGDVSPLIIGGNAIYLQARGSIVRDLGFEFSSDGYRGNDLTIFASHLFDGYTITDWTYAQTPHSIVWAVRNDGKLLGLTYIREQAIVGWHTHDFQDGSVENVVSIAEGNQDGLYLVINRTIDGQTKRYIERFASRIELDVKDLIFVDSSLSFDGRNTNTSHTMTLSGGTTWEYDESITLTSSTSFFSSLTDVGKEIHLTGSDGTLIRCAIESVSSGTVVTVKPDKTVPTSMRSVAISNWAEAVSEIGGLWHLNGQTLSVQGDAFVVANPNNPDYETVTVSNGTATLERPYAVIHAGLPFTSDILTLNIDSPDVNTIADKNKIIQRLTIFFESSRGVWAGPNEPESSTSIADLIELKMREFESYDDPIDLKTGTVEVNIAGEWNREGNVFIRQSDPLPMSVLAVMPEGVYPFRG